MSKLSCYNGYSWHVTAPRRLNSPGISKKQLLISALQPLIRMHCSWGNTRRNKIIWVLAIPVSAVHCKMPEGKKKSQTDKPFIWFSLCLSVFFPLFSQRHGALTYWHGRTQYNFAISHTICKTAKKWPLHFAEKIHSDKTEQFTSWVLCFSFARHYPNSLPMKNEGKDCFKTYLISAV